MAEHLGTTLRAELARAHSSSGGRGRQVLADVALADVRHGLDSVAHVGAHVVPGQGTNVQAARLTDEGSCSAQGAGTGGRLQVRSHCTCDVLSGCLADVALALLDRTLAGAYVLTNTLEGFGLERLCTDILSGLLCFLAGRGDATEVVGIETRRLGCLGL